MDDRTALRSLIFDSLEEQIALVDAAGAIVDVNAAWTRFGSENAVAPGTCGVGVDYLAVVRRAFATGDVSAGEAARGIEAVLRGASPAFELEYPCDAPDGKRWFMMRMGPLKGASERLFVVSHADITKRKRAEERAEFLAGHDALTGLANRRRFDAFLEEEMRRRLRDRSPLSLLLIDVDRFKEYNDLLGHVAGDRCLVRIARALLEASRRPGDLAARIGGDEFALVLGATPLAHAQAVAESIARAIEGLGMVSGSSRVTASIGIACVAPHSSTTPDRLVLEADRALYAAKAAGGNRASAASSAVGGTS